MGKPSQMVGLPEIADRLRQGDRKITAPRQAILNILRQECHPLTCKEIHSRLPKGDCNLATIYRSLHLLEDMGLVKRFDFGDNTARFELMTEDGLCHHHHLICTRCAAITEIEACFPKELEEQIARDHGFQEISHKLEFFGLCRQCAVDPSEKPGH